MARIPVYVVTIAVLALAVGVRRMMEHEGSGPVGRVVQRVKGVLGIPHLRNMPAEAYRHCGHYNSSSYYITSSRVVLPSGVAAATVQVVDGKVVSVEFGKPSSTQSPVLDFGDMVISPGVVDVHAHLNEPGKEEWEGISTGTAAAAAGGVTTLVDMPLNSFPCTCNHKELSAKVALAKAKSHVNMGFWAGLIPKNAFWVDQLDAMVNEGAIGFKAFLSPSGIDDFPNVSQIHVNASLSLLKFKGVPLMVHAELVSEPQTSEEDEDAPPATPQGDPTLYQTYMDTRPPAFEHSAIEMLLQTLMAHEPHKWNKGFGLHIAHLSDATSLAMLKLAKQVLPVTVETCPHYLLFTSETIPTGSTLHKCAPPIRGEANRDALVAAILDGTIDLISSDHSPAPPAMKEVESGDFLKAWGGISGLQMLLPATWTALAPHGLTLERLATLLSDKPSQVAGLSSSKGTIEAGKDADFVVWDPEADTNTSPEAYLHKHKASPYLGMSLKGAVQATFVHGNLVWSQADGLPSAPCGHIVTPPEQRRL